MSNARIIEFPESEWGEMGSEDRRKRLQKNSRLIQDYGLTLKAFENMKLAQGNLCALCSRPEESERNELCVDHDHVSGAIRALLCTKCNKGLGLFGDSIEQLETALKYLKQHRG